MRREAEQRKNMKAEGKLGEGGGERGIWKRIKRSISVFLKRGSENDLGSSYRPKANKT